MGDRPNRATPTRGRPEATLRRSVIALVVTALLAFAVVATGTSIVAGHIARSDALDEALRSAHVIGTTVFAPLLPAAIRGDRSAIAALDDAVRIRARDGSLVRVKVWKRDGTIVYSDDDRAIGRSGERSRSTTMSPTPSMSRRAASTSRTSTTPRTRPNGGSTTAWSRSTSR
jgi:two-component system, NarL family, sensor kinase